MGESGDSAGDKVEEQHGLEGVLKIDVGDDGEVPGAKRCAIVDLGSKGNSARFGGAGDRVQGRNHIIWEGDNNGK
ncbi:unnamed protein product [Linum trigynum]|uniref:Uncharacterized protein n=1 Tax=Linum trigynum TaxID=586398 RepID=A0AAV2E576_9ROSI